MKPPNRPKYADSYVSFIGSEMYNPKDLFDGVPQFGPKSVRIRIFIKNKKLAKLAEDADLSFMRTLLGQDGKPVITTIGGEGCWVGGTSQDSDMIRIYQAVYNFLQTIGLEKLKEIGVKPSGNNQ